MIKTLVYTYEKRDLLKKEFLNKLDSIWGNWHNMSSTSEKIQCFCVSFFLGGGRSECRQWLLLLVIRWSGVLQVVVWSAFVGDIHVRRDAVRVGARRVAQYTPAVRLPHAQPQHRFTRRVSIYTVKISVCPPPDVLWRVFNILTGKRFRMYVCIIRKSAE